MTAAIYIYYQPGASAACSFALKEEGVQFHHLSREDKQVGHDNAQPEDIARLMKTTPADDEWNDEDIQRQTNKLTNDMTHS